MSETVKVLEGPFANFQGKVEEIDKDKGKVKVLSTCSVVKHQWNLILIKLKKYNLNELAIVV